jgi:hypothetical protein
MQQRARLEMVVRSNGGATACQYLTRTGILVVIASSSCQKYD